jgi:hypothetical protein
MQNKNLKKVVVPIHMSLIQFIKYHNIIQYQVEMAIQKYI